MTTRLGVSAAALVAGAFTLGALLPRVEATRPEPPAGMTAALDVPGGVEGPTPTPFYEYEIVARPGDEGTISLFPEVSIVDSGTVGFTGLTRIEPGGTFGGAFEDGALLKADLGRQAVNVTPAGGGSFATAINGRGQFLDYGVTVWSGIGFPEVLAWSSLQIVDPGPSQVLWTQQARGLWSAEDFTEDRLPQFFEHVGPWAAMNDSGQIAFVAADGRTLSSPPAGALGDVVVERLVLATPLGAPGSGGFNGVLLQDEVALDQLDRIAPDIAEDGRIVVRRGIKGDSPIVVFDYGLVANETIAGAASGFTLLGGKPAISNDGNVIAFLGNRGEGPGLFVAIDDGEGYQRTDMLVRVAGENGSEPRPELGYAPPVRVEEPDIGSIVEELPPIYFASFDLSQRIGVTHVERAPAGLAGDSVTVAFAGTPSRASRPNPHAPGSPLLFSSAKGIWTVRVDFKDIPAPDGSGGRIVTAFPRSAIPVAQIGDSIANFKIRGLTLHDPIALAPTDETGAPRDHRGRGDHRVAFGAVTSAGNIIVRATHLDTDEDGLLDHWETDGIDMDGDGTTDLELSRMGALPDRKDLFLELDWLVPRKTGYPVPWSNQIQPNVTGRLAKMFLEGDVDNPDGSRGIKLHIDAGPEKAAIGGESLSVNIPDESLLRGGSLVHPLGRPDQHLDVVTNTGGRPPTFGVSVEKFSDVKERFFGNGDRGARELAFHYGLLSDFSAFVEDADGRAEVDSVESATNASGRGVLVADMALPDTKLVNGAIIMTSGRALGQLRFIRSVAERKLLLDREWGIVPQAGDDFVFLDQSLGRGEALSVGDTFLPGNDISLTFAGHGISGDFLGSPLDQFLTTAHELGHNLGLGHCGESLDAEDCDDVSGRLLLRGGPAIVVEGSLEHRLAASLSGRPSAPVHVALESSFGLFDVSPDTLTFSDVDWNVPKEILINARDDSIRNEVLDEDFGNRPGEKFRTDGLHYRLTSADLRFDGDEDTSGVIVYDDERPTLVIRRNFRDIITVLYEDAKYAGQGDSYDVQLSAPPSSEVVVEVQATNTRLSSNSLRFNETNWSVPQRVELLPVPKVEGDVTPTDSDDFITHNLTSAEPTPYHGLQVYREFRRIGFASGALVALSPEQVVVNEDGASAQYRLVQTGLIAPAEIDVDFEVGPDLAPIETVTLTADSPEAVITVRAIDDDWGGEGIDEVDIRHIVRSRNVIGVYDEPAPSQHVFILDNDPDLEPDHRSLMSYAHDGAGEDAIEDYAGPGDRLVDEWSNLKPDFFSVFPNVGDFPRVDLRVLGLTPGKYLELFGHLPDVEGPRLTLPEALASAVPLSSRPRLRVLAEDELSGVASVVVTVDLDGNGAIDPQEEAEAVEIGPGVFEVNVAPLAGAVGGRPLRVLAEDRAGNVTLEEVTLDVVPESENAPPVAVDGVVTTGEGVPVAMTLVATDGNATPLTYRIETPPEHGALSGVIPRLSYAPEAGFTGIDRFTFTASDGLATSNLATVRVVVGDANRPPAVAPIDSPVVNDGTSVEVAVSATDPDGDALSLLASGLPPFATFEDLGGGSARLLLEPGIEHVGTYAGVTIEASDDLFRTPEVFDVTVVRLNDPPVLLPIGDKSAYEGFTVRYAIVASDPDGDALSFSATGLPGFATLTPVGGNHAQLKVSPVDFQDAGEYPVSLTVSDGEYAATESFDLLVSGDTLEPELRLIFPPDGATYLSGLQTVRMEFTEPLAEATVNASSFQLLANGSTVTPIAVERRNLGSVVSMIFDPLPAGSYEVFVDAPNVTDYGGNPVGATPFVPSRFELVDELGTSDSLFPDRVYETGATGSSQMVAGDVDGDGVEDLVVGRGFSVSLLRGVGDGTFAEPTVVSPARGGAGVALADVDVDGDLDIVGAGSGGGLGFLHTLLGNGDGTFSLPIELIIGQPEALALGDMDGDGIVDAVTVGGEGGAVALGRGDGTFTVVDSPSQAEEMVALGDVNGDGVLDVVSRRVRFSAVNVYLGIGDGTLSGATSYFTEKLMTDLKLGDLDDDGDLDVVATTRLTDESALEIFLNDGEGVYTAGSTFDLAARRPLDLRLSDLDGDGHLDVAVGLEDRFLVSPEDEADVVAVRLGNGDGTFRDQINVPTVRNPGRLAVDDFDVDGVPDIAAVNNWIVGVHLGNGDGTFPVDPDYDSGGLGTDLDLGDVDGDGHLDAVVALKDAFAPDPGGLSVLRGGGDGSFGPPEQLELGPSPRFVALRDLNEDGALDVVVGYDFTSAISVGLGNGDGTFASPTDYAVGGGPHDVDFGDVDGNGTLDLVSSASGSSRLSVLLGDGAGGFTPFLGVENRADYSSVALGDIDGDGDLDAVAKFEDGPYVEILPGNGDGTFDAPDVFFETATKGGEIRLVDLDGDGKLDVVSGSLNTITRDGDHFISVLLGNGDGTFAPHVDYPVGDRPVSLAIGLVDDDAFLDVVTTHQEESMVSILLGRGDGTLRSPTAYDVGRLPAAVALGDLNRDGKLDFVTASLRRTIYTFEGSISPRLQFSAGAGGGGGPVADAGSDRLVDVGAVVTLDGTGSSGARPKDVLVHRWQQTVGPDVTLTGETSPTPSFVPEVPGTYRFELAVSSGGVSATDVVTVTAAGAPDLALALSDGVEAVVAGDRVDYAITVTNVGNVTAAGISLKSQWPGFASFSSASDGGSPSGLVVEWPPFILAPGESATRTLALTMPDAFASGIRELAVAAQVTDDAAVGIDPTPGNNAASDANVVVAHPDVSVALDDEKSSALPGELSTYVLTVSNAGDQGASGVAASFELPPATSLVNASDGGSAANGVLTWPAFSLEAGGGTARSVTIRLDDDWPFDLSEVRARAIAGDAGDDGPDPNVANNVATDVDGVTRPDLAVTLDDGRSALSPGREATYHLTVENRGDRGSTGVTVAVALPGAMSFVSADGGGAAAGSDVIWPDLALAPGDRADMTLTARLDEPPPGDEVTLAVVASVHDDGASGPDRFPEDNVASDVDRWTEETDLAASLLASEDPVALGSDLVYTLRVDNLGATRATGVRLENLLPAAAELLDIAGSEAICRESQLVSCAIPDLEASQSATIFVTVRPSAEGVLTTVLNVTSESVELDGSNNRAVLTTTVEAEASENHPPVADAGPDQNVGPDTEVTLDGTESFDPDGDLLTFDWSLNWSLDAKPPGSALDDGDIPGRTSPVASFTPDVVGRYVVRLVVNDGELDSEPDTVVVLVASPNVPPNADAGDDENVVVGSDVVLDGTSSEDPDGGPDPLQFLWTFDAVPAGSLLTEADIVGSETALAGFVPDVAGAYVIRLRVADGADADEDVVLVTAATNAAPNALAGPDMQIPLGGEAALDASGSDDPDGGPLPLLFHWQFVFLPVGSALGNVDIVDADSTTPRFTPDVEGSYVLELEVFDGAANDFDNVMVTASSVVDPDLNNDGIVNILDASLVASCYGRAVAGAPEIEIFAPPDGAVLGSPSVDVAGTVDPPEAIVEVNGFAAQRLGDAFLASDVPLAAGRNTIVVTAVGVSDLCFVADTNRDRIVDLSDVQFVLSSFGVSGFAIGAEVPDSGSASVAIRVRFEP